MPNQKRSIVTPIIIGANHLAVTRFGREYGKLPENLKECTESARRLSNYLRSLPTQKRPRTLFIEGRSESFEEKTLDVGGNNPPFKESAENEPFLAAVRVARENGWKIVPLDDRIKAPSTDFYMFGTPESALFHDMNFREDSWARFLLGRALPQDIVLTHSGHVRGVLLKTGWNKKRVVWINKPEKEWARKRLTPKRLGALRAAILKEVAKPKPHNHIFASRDFGGKILKRLNRK